MERRSARRVFLGVQWSACSWDDAALWCDVLVGKTGKAPLCWILPCPPAAGRRKTAADVLGLVGERLAAGGDTLAAMGFAGACQPLLSLDELDRELSWCRRNPWGTGLAEVLGTTPRILMPRLPDLRRPAAVEACRASGFLRVGAALDGTFRQWPAGPGLQAFSFWRLPAGGPPAQRRPQIPRGDLFLVLDLDGLSSPQALEGLLDAVVLPLLPSVARFPAEPSAAEGQPGRNPPAPPLPWPDPGRDIFPSPLARQRLELAAPLSRKRRKRAEEYQRLLAILSPGPLAEPGQQGAPRKAPSARLPVAHMLGEITLAGSDFDVKLAGGRFLGLTRRNVPLLPLHRAASYLRVAGRTHAFRGRGSFSFETAGGTGLREELTLDGIGDRTGALSVEYSFEDGSPRLCIHAEISWPRLDEGAAVEECVPFAIVLRELTGATACVRADAPDGSSCQYTVRDGEGWLAVPGTRQEVDLEGGGRLVVRWAEEAARRWGIPYFRVSRCLGRRRGLELSPFGAAAGLAGRWLSGTREFFSLSLGVEGGG